MGNSVLEKVFSVKNDDRKTHKVVTVLGAKIKFKKDGIKSLKQKIEDYKIMHDSSLYVGIPKDITLQLMFNSGCNSKCKFCYVHNVNNKNTYLMPKEWVYKTFKSIYPYTQHLVPTYGEITFGAEGYNYLNWITQNYPHINIFMESNGIAFTDRWAKMAAKNLFNVNFSVNAVDEESYKKTVWEKDGIFTLIMNNIKHYLDVLKENGTSMFKPSISCVLNSSNYHNTAKFIKMAAQLGIQKVIIFFDAKENSVERLSVKDKEGFYNALITLIELTKLLEKKMILGFKLFIPICNIEEYENKVKNTSIEEYSDIWKLAKDFDYYENYKQKVEKYKEYNKKPLTYYEEKTGVTYHQEELKGKIICTNPWKHIRLRTSGLLDFCSWRGYKSNIYIQDFIENGLLNVEKLFNDKFYRRLRKDFAKGCYTNCLKNCPGSRFFTKQEFEVKYKAERC